MEPRWSTIAHMKYVSQPSPKRELRGVVPRAVASDHAGPLELGRLRLTGRKNANGRRVAANAIAL